jgi:hypothetical protein
LLPTQFFRIGPNILKMIVTSLKRRFFGSIVTSNTSSNDQQADILTKSLRDSRIEFICKEFGAYNIYASACGGVLEF